MEYVLTSAEMKASDKAAIETYGISSLVLMERAALQTVKVIIERFWRGSFMWPWMTGKRQQWWRWNCDRKNPSRARDSLRD